MHDPRWDEIIAMNEETLRDKIANLKARLEKSMIDRNYVQLERVKKTAALSPPITIMNIYGTLTIILLRCSFSP